MFSARLSTIRRVCPTTHAHQTCLRPKDSEKTPALPRFARWECRGVAFDPLPPRPRIRVARFRPSLSRYTHQNQRVCPCYRISGRHFGASGFAAATMITPRARRFATLPLGRPLPQRAPELPSRARFSECGHQTLESEMSGLFSSRSRCLLGSTPGKMGRLYATERANGRNPDRLRGANR